MTPSISAILDRLTDAQKRVLLRTADTPATSRRGYCVNGHQWRPVRALRSLGLIYIEEMTDLRTVKHFAHESIYLRPEPLGIEVAKALRASEGNRS